MENHFQNIFNSPILKFWQDAQRKLRCWDGKMKPLNLFTSLRGWKKSADHLSGNKSNPCSGRKMGKRKEQYSEEFINKLKSVKAKRAKTVIDHILKHGAISTEELKDVYGYDHPPRAVRDVREQGIPSILSRFEEKMVEQSPHINLGHF